MNDQSPHASLAVIDGDDLYCYPCARDRFGHGVIQDLIDDTDFASNGKGGYLGGVMRKYLVPEDVCLTCNVPFVVEEKVQ